MRTSTRTSSPTEMGHEALARYADWASEQIGGGGGHPGRKSFTVPVSFPAPTTPEHLPPGWEHLFTVHDIHDVHLLRTPRAWLLMLSTRPVGGPTRTVLVPNAFETLGELAQATFDAQSTVAASTHDAFAALFARCIDPDHYDPQAEAFLRALLTHPSIPPAAYRRDPFATQP